MLPAILIGLTVHEWAHAYAAYRLGDPTARNLGRMTLNPIAHIDLIGFLMLLLVGFGWAKPVPVNFANLRHPKRDMIWVALAGPASNLIQALFWGALLYVLLGLGLHEPFFLQMCKGGVLVNIVMFVFNLFPLPPLDGGRVLTGLLPREAANALARVEPYGFFIVMALVVSGVVSSLWMRPLMNATYGLLEMLLTPLKLLFS